jgi:hypothetical protein
MFLYGNLEARERKKRRGKKEGIKELTERMTNNTKQSRHKVWLSNIMSEEERQGKGQRFERISDLLTYLRTPCTLLFLMVWPTDVFSTACSF